jgi:hypothetical protein
VNFPAVARTNFTQTNNKILVIFLVDKKSFPTISASHDVINCTGIYKSKRSCHDLKWMKEVEGQAKCEMRGLTPLMLGSLTRLLLKPLALGKDLAEGQTT